MASFKAFVTTVLLLLLVIDVYSAPAAAASLEAVEEVAKDQETTEVAADNDHEIRGRVLINIGSFGLGKKGMDPLPEFIDGLEFVKTVSEIPMVKNSFTPPAPIHVPEFPYRFNFPPPPAAPIRSSVAPPSYMRLLELRAYYDTLDKKFCNPVYCYPETHADGSNYCGCSFESKPYNYRNPCEEDAVAYCCQAKNKVCSKCCFGKNGPRGDVRF